MVKTFEADETFEAVETPRSQATDAFGSLAAQVAQAAVAGAANTARAAAARIAGSAAAQAAVRVAGTARSAGARVANTAAVQTAAHVAGTAGTAAAAAAARVAGAARTACSTATRVADTAGSQASRFLQDFSRSYIETVREGCFAPRAWEFWRALITAFCVCCLIGHWLEAAYCFGMDSLFGIVADDYAIRTDPWLHPYWVYGFGAIGLTFGIEPLRAMLLKHSKTLQGAVSKTFVLSVVLSMLMELGFGLLVNQPDAAGVYPFWDNSDLPLNIFGQAWLVNDLFIGLAGTAYVWLVYPAISALFKQAKSERSANIALACTAAAFCLVCAVSYSWLALFIWPSL